MSQRDETQPVVPQEVHAEPKPWLEQRVLGMQDFIGTVLEKAGQIERQAEVMAEDLSDQVHEWTDPTQDAPADVQARYDQATSDEIV